MAAIAPAIAALFLACANLNEARAVPPNESQKAASTGGLANAGVADEQGKGVQFRWNPESNGMLVVVVSGIDSGLLKSAPGSSSDPSSRWASLLKVYAGQGDLGSDVPAM